MKKQPMGILHHIFLVALIACAGVWIWASVMLNRQIADDEAYFSPILEKEKQQSEAFQNALNDSRDGRITPLPTYELPDRQQLDEGLKRMKKRHDYASKRDLAGFGFMATGFLWGLAAQIQAAVQRRRWEAPDRPAVASAGKLIGEMVQSGQVFVARGKGGRRPKEVKVDGGRAVVVFRNFQFTTHFAWNPVRDCVEVPFNELLVATTQCHKGNWFLNLRTTRGKVIITEKVRPFQTLADVLIDAVELNRTSPEQYRAALAREPVVRTPWYGWLIIVAALGAVAGIFWLTMQN